MQRSRFWVGLIGVLGLLSGGIAAAQYFVPLLINQISQVNAIIPVVNVISVLLSPVAVFVVGYWLGTTNDVATEYRRIALMFGGVGGGATFVGFLAVNIWSTTAAGNIERLTLGIALISAFGDAIFFAIVGFAGAALGHFRSTEDSERSI